MISVIRQVNAPFFQGLRLKKFLNEFMGSDDSAREEVLAKREDTFIRVIDFILEHFGDTAFQNVTLKKGSNQYEFTGKFNPPIFDSIMTATQIALDSGNAIDTADLNGKRQNLLQDEGFRDYILIRTTNRDRIAKRIDLALSYLYGMNYV